MESILTQRFESFLLRRWQRAALWVVVPAFAVLWAGGVATHWRGGARAADVWLASVFLALAGLVVLLGARTGRGALALLCVALLGFAAEVLGSNTGLPFGAYHYTDALRPRLFGAPFVIGLAWMVLVAQAWSIVAPLGLGRPLAVALGALWTTAVDLVIDPLAAGQFGYWRWEQGGLYYGIPATNFAGWLLTSLVALGLFAPRLEAGFWPRAVGLAVVLFFTLAALAAGLTVPALVGLALCAAQLLAGARARRGPGVRARG